jgi:hypothetical protein
MEPATVTVHAAMNIVGQFVAKLMRVEVAHILSVFQDETNRLSPHFASLNRRVADIHRRTVPLALRKFLKIAMSAAWLDEARTGDADATIVHNGRNGNTCPVRSFPAEAASVNDWG